MGEAGEAAVKESKAWAKQKQIREARRQRIANAADKAREQSLARTWARTYSWNRADDFGAGNTTVWSQKKLDRRNSDEIALQERSLGGIEWGLTWPSREARQRVTGESPGRAHWGSSDTNEEQVKLSGCSEAEG